MYTGEVLVSTNNIESLISAAAILEMNDLKTICFCFLEDILSKDDARKYLNNRHSRLVQKYQNHALGDLTELMLSPRLLSTSEALMKVILSADNLEVKSEVEVCEVLMKWLEVQTEAGQEVHSDQLLPLIRWSGVSVNYVKSKLRRNTTLTSDPASLSFMTKVITYLMPGVHFEGLQTFHRPSTGIDNFLMVIGLNDSFTSSSKVCRISLQHPDRVANQLTAIPTKLKVYSAACACNDTVYVTGSGTTFSETWKWNAERGWVKCSDMLNGRRAHCVAVVESTLYALGGQMNRPTNSVESYNIDTNIWSPAGYLMHAVSFSGCVVYKKSIYMFGGQNAHFKVVDHVQVYNPAHESCTLMSKPMPRAYLSMNAVLWETSVILLGHENCFIYNFATQTWQERERFKTEINGFATTLDNSTVYVAGGFKWSMLQRKYTDEIKSVSVLDIMKNRQPIWRHHGKLPRAAVIFSSVSISLP